MRDPEQFSELTDRIPLWPNLVVVGLLVVVALLIIGFASGAKYGRWIELNRYEPIDTGRGYGLELDRRGASSEGWIPDKPRGEGE